MLKTRSSQRARKRRADATHAEAPSKPYPEFPLFAHATGRWAKKIRGRTEYFGPWADPDGALDIYLKQNEALHAGRRPRPTVGLITIKDVVNNFLTAKMTMRDGGELSPRTWAQYKETCDQLVSHLGKGRLVADLGPDDFADLRRKLARRWELVTIGNFIQRVRVIFNHAAASALLQQPVNFGPTFKRPSKKAMRIKRAGQAPNLFTADEIRRVMEAASPQLKAMTLLAINAGLGNADCGRLRVRAIDLDAAWLTYPREKTGVDRRCWLWPETVREIRDVQAKRPTPKADDDADLIFVTRYGQSWHTGTNENPIAYEFGKLLRKLGINGRKRLGFYTLRHTFRTIADEARDQPAADYIMGHESPHMSTHYRERIADDRLRAVAEHIRAWLFKKGDRKRHR